jgi:RecA/RadA recombinase
MTLHAIAEAQKSRWQLWCRTRIRQKLCWKIRGRYENLIISQPDNGEQALEIAENLFVQEQLTLS